MSRRIMGSTERGYVKAAYTVNSLPQEPPVRGKGVTSDPSGSILHFEPDSGLK